MTIKVVPTVAVAVHAVVCLCLVASLFATNWYAYSVTVFGSSATLNIGLLGMCSTTAVGFAVSGNLDFCFNLRQYVAFLSDANSGIKGLDTFSQSGLVGFIGLGLALVVTGAALVAAAIACLDDLGGSSTAVYRATKAAATLACVSGCIILGVVAQWAVWGVATNISANASDFGWAAWLTLALGVFEVVVSVVGFVSLRDSDARVYTEFMPLMALNGPAARQYL
eukprot:a513098_18.p2 GENE.a513098_18~~a513098_18.p2  ORF type:complete len:238 (+),score=87.53 a513098_18:43-714(+)